MDSLLLNDLVDQAQSFPSFGFMDMMNDSEASLNLEVTVQDLLNTTNNESERERLRRLQKRRMPYVENFHEQVTESKPTLAGIHISRRNVLGFTLRTEDGYHDYNPSMR